MTAPFRSAAWAVPALWEVEGANWALIGYILLGAGALLTVDAGPGPRGLPAARRRCDGG